MTTALVNSSQRFPFCLTDYQLDILADMHHRLSTPERHAWWFSQGKAAGASGEQCAAPLTMIRERRLYRLGWIFGRLHRYSGGVKPLPCCAATIKHKLNPRNKACVRCGTEL